MRLLRASISVRAMLVVVAIAALGSWWFIAR